MLCPYGDSEQMGVVRALMEAMPPRVQAVLFQHPLLQTFVRLKWAGLRPFFLLLVALHVAFVVSLSHYSVQLVTDANAWTTKNPECHTFTDNFTLLATAGIVLLYLAGQLLLLPRFYVREMETWLHFLSAILALAAAVIPYTNLGRLSRYPFNDYGVLDCGQEYTRSNNETNFTVVDMKKKMRNGLICVPLVNVTSTYNDISVLTNCGEPHPSEFVLLSLALLLGWLQLMLLAGRFSGIGYYALMFQTVLFNVLKVLASFCFLVVGFALSFCVLFNNMDTFHTWWDSLARTIVMSTGEMEYTSLFKTPNISAPLTREVDDNEYLEVTSRVVFFIFIILAPIVLMNLMVGLAVSDIQSLLEEGLIRMTLKQADFVAHLESLSSRISMPRFLRRLCCALLGCCRCRVGRHTCRLLNGTVASRLTLQPLFQGPGAIRLDDDLLESLAVLALRNRERERRRRRKAMTFGCAQAAQLSQGHQRPLGLALSVPPEGNRRSRSSGGYSSSSSTDSDYTVGSGYNRGGGGGGGGGTGGCGDGGRGVAAAVRVRMETEDTSAGELSPPPAEARSPLRRPSELPTVQPPSARAHGEILRQLRRLRREVNHVRAQLWTDDAPTPGLLSAPSRRAGVVRRKRTLAEADATAATAAASFRRRRASHVQIV